MCVLYSFKCFAAPEFILEYLFSLIWVWQSLFLIAFTNIMFCIGKTMWADYAYRVVVCPKLETINWFFWISCMYSYIDHLWNEVYCAWDFLRIVHYQEKIIIKTLTFSFHQTINCGSTFLKWCNLFAIHIMLFKYRFYWNHKSAKKDLKYFQCESFWHFNVTPKPWKLRHGPWLSGSWHVEHGTWDLEPGM